MHVVRIIVAEAGYEADIQAVLAEQVVDLFDRRLLVAHVTGHPVGHGENHAVFGNLAVAAPAIVIQGTVVGIAVHPAEQAVCLAFQGTQHRVIEISVIALQVPGCQQDELAVGTLGLPGEAAGVGRRGAVQLLGTFQITLVTGCRIEGSLGIEADFLIIVIQIGTGTDRFRVQDNDIFRMIIQEFISDFRCLQAPVRKVRIDFSVDQRGGRHRADKGCRGSGFRINQDHVLMIFGRIDEFGEGRGNRLGIDTLVVGLHFQHPLQFEAGFIQHIRDTVAGVRSGRSIRAECRVEDISP